VRERLVPTVEAFALLAITLPVALALGQPGLWFLVPFALITLRRRDYADYGLNLSTWRSCGGHRFHLMVVTATFVPYAAGHALLGVWLLGRHLEPAVPAGMLWLVIDQLIGVALPEEFFFRGYLQSQFNRSFGRPFVLLGCRWGIGLPLAALLFALCHVPLGGIGQLSVFFPGLLYGWLRERTDSVVVSTVYHAASNILLKVMLLSLVAG
jgi:membrane protease YdiL (CAAX protease family)